MHSLSRRLISSVKKHECLLNIKPINLSNVKYTSKYSKSITKIQFPLYRSFSTTCDVYSEKKSTVPDPSVPPRQARKNPSQSFDITAEPKYDEYKIHHLNNLTLVTEAEVAPLEEAFRNSKDIDQSASSIALRKLLHYYLYHGNAEYSLLYYNDLIVIEHPLVFEYDMLFSVLAESKNFKEINRLYKHFRSSGQRPTSNTFNILFKALGESGDIALIMEIYESSFVNRNIPTIENIFQIVKCAAIAGEPKNFHRFFARINYKGYEVPKKALQLFSDVWGTNKCTSEYSKSVFINTFDFSRAMELLLRVRNYKVAIDMIYECRDIFNIQPDAMMYETLLSACLRDGFLTEKARVWKKRFHKYPKGIEVRSEHFEFADFVKEIQDYLGDSIRKATPVNDGELIKVNKTSRRQSRKLYKFYDNERYRSEYEDLDKFDWVPEYMQRKKEGKLAKAQTEKADFLSEIEAQAQAEQLSLQQE